MKTIIEVKGDKFVLDTVKEDRYVYVLSGETRTSKEKLKRDYLEMQRNLDELYKLRGEEFEDYLDSERGVCVVGEEEVIIRDLIHSGLGTDENVNHFVEMIECEKYPKHVIIGGTLFVKVENEERAKKDRYYVGTDGRVFSLYSKGFLIPQYNEDNYYHCILRGEKNKYYHHQIVKTSFCGLPPKYVEVFFNEGDRVSEVKTMQVHHINRNGAVNTLENLEYLTISENLSFTKRLREEEARLIYVTYLYSKAHKLDFNAREIAEEFETTERVVKNVLKGEVYRRYTEELRRLEDVEGKINKVATVEAIYIKLLEIVKNAKEYDKFVEGLR